MRQVTQRLRNGKIEVLEVPAPALRAEGVIVDVRASLISAGTERSTVEAARSGLVGKARARPDQARAVFDRARQEGLRSTLDAVRSKLDQPSSLGYSSAGVVLATGAKVSGLRPGDRVACAGGGLAVHGELNSIPGNLCVRLPESVSFEAAAFATVGSVAMHGVRQAEAALGERIAVVGLGLVGQLTCRLLVAAGCQVTGVDVREELLERARASGVPAVLRSQIDLASPPAALRDCDSVILTASTASDDPMRLAAAIARDRARVVVVGEVGMNVPRPPFYGKELELRLSRSYGPGRYDRTYEERGIDYPIGYVRWTERRNMAAFVELIGAGRLTVDDLITARFSIDEAPQAYELLLANETTPLGIVLTYEETPLSSTSAREVRRPSSRQSPRAAPAVGVIGAGSFAQRVLVPGLREAGFALQLIASASGLSAASAAKRFGFSGTATPDELVAAADVDAVAVASRHDSHASYAIAALQAGKAVFVEKPPALTLAELDELAEASAGGVLQVGFNRRFAPLAGALREHIEPGQQPVELLYRVAAGRLPDNHWLHDPDAGGGRLLGEGCHFVDFCCWLMGELPDGVQASIPAGPHGLGCGQRFALTLTFSNASVATIVYGSEAATGVAKELIEAHSGGRSAVLHDYRRLELRGKGRTRTVRDRRRDKGHVAQFHAFRHRVDGSEATGVDPLETMRATLMALQTARSEPLATD